MRARIHDLDARIAARIAKGARPDDFLCVDCLCWSEDPALCACWSRPMY